MICGKLRQGMNSDCKTLGKKYAQRVVLVNKSDIANKRIETSFENIDGSYVCRHRVLFNLLENTTGYAFTINGNASSIFANVEKTMVEGVPQYLHSITIAVTGVDEETKCVLDQLDYSNYFGAVQFSDGTVEVYGFEFGLGTNSYTYDPANSGGGGLIPLRSASDALEDYLPFVYKSSIDGNETTDFENNFADIPFFENGDFNDDFNNDFDNE